MGHWESLFDERLEVTPPLDDEQLAQIPAKRGVFLLAGDDAPITLITAASIRQRIRTRLDHPEQDRRTKSADLRAITRQVFWKRTFSEFETDLAFIEIARVLWPGDYADLLPWKAPWLVEVCLSQPYPYFCVSRKLPTGQSRAFGPFARNRDADRFIGAVQDAFDLCRDIRCLRQSPHGQPCAYKEMKRCLSPCDGTISQQDYREVVLRAIDFACGNVDTLRHELQERMKEAASQLEFEKAGLLKSRLERLEEFDAVVFDQVRPVDELRFLVIQKGSRFDKGRVFFVDRGAIHCGGEIDYPLKPDQLQQMLAAMERFVQCKSQQDSAANDRAGLVSWYLFSGPQKRGLMLPWDSHLKCEKLASEIEAGKDLLGLREAKRGKSSNEKEKTSQNE